ncbi:MAG: hypothetical protein ACREUO_03550, partial [Burkholderiales bacterium]
TSSRFVRIIVPIMNAAAYAPTLASVIVLRIQEFARRPVAEQARLKAQLEALVARAIQPLPAAGRIVLDAPDAVAIAVLDSAENALALAERSQAAAADLPLCIAVNHGPVKPAPDALRGPGLVGDGLAAGMTLANAATPGRFIVSRSFREALEAAAPGRAANLSPIGTITDSSVRAHELFTVDRRAAAARRRWLFAAGSATAIAIIGLGIAARRLLHPPKPPVLPAVIGLAITPQGDVLLDGILQGRSPPLTRLEVSPGPHRIEVRNDPHPPLKLEANLGSAEEMTITHSFSTPTPPKPARAPKSAKKREEGFVEGMRRRLGI